jgi:hypothetical protein
MRALSCEQLCEPLGGASWEPFYLPRRPLPDIKKGIALLGSCFFSPFSTPSAFSETGLCALGSFFFRRCKLKLKATMAEVGLDVVEGHREARGVPLLVPSPVARRRDRRRKRRESRAHHAAVNDRRELEHALRRELEGHKLLPRLPETRAPSRPGSGAFVVSGTEAWISGHRASSARAAVVAAMCRA